MSDASRTPYVLGQLGQLERRVADAAAIVTFFSPRFSSAESCFIKLFQTRQL